MSMQNLEEPREPGQMVFRRPKQESSDGVWLISYSDMMTVLMGFFALMLSMSTIDSSKSAAIQEAATEYFGGEYKRPFEELAKNLENVVKKENLNNQVQIQQDANSITLTFKGTLLFDSGLVDLKPDALELFNKIIPLIKENAEQYYLLIEGHTDNVPISHSYIVSNWELSGLRASTVARRFEDFKFAKEKMMVVGWGETRPLAPNLTEQGIPIPENQSANRRVIIKVLKSPIM